jgi:trk system potassium uptake protein TrkH
MKQGDPGDAPTWSALVSILVAAAVLVDLVWVRPATGVAGIVLMLAGCMLVARDWAGLLLHRESARFSPFRRVELGLLFGMIGFTLARGFILYRQLLPADATVDQRAHAARLYDIVYALLLLAAAYGFKKLPRVVRLFSRLAARPLLLLPVSMAAAILLGTLLLSLPVSVRSVGDVSILEAFFTMTSAVCVTGLVVNDIATTYSWFGQAVILAGIQFGGIGVMTVAVLVLSIARERRLEDFARFAEAYSARTFAHLRSLVRSIVIWTVAIELAGAVLLWLVLHRDPRFADWYVPWLAVFHAVSAFCNAGFSLFPNNLVSYRFDFAIQIVIMLLIVLGGLGFPVLHELGTRIWRRPESRVPLSHGSRTVLIISAILVFAGAAGVFVLESGRSLAGMPFEFQALASLFTSVTSRTAGFSTLEFERFGTAGLLWVGLLMIIGGSPASTAGGIKTTTFAVLLEVVMAEIRGREPRLGNRAIPERVVRRATAVAGLFLAASFTLVFLLSLSEPAVPFTHLLFESLSALATVGLSTGTTAGLGGVSKVMICLAMFLGRTGPLAIAAAVQGRTRDRFRLPVEELPIG